jgi:hypothetical protein
MPRPAELFAEDKFEHNDEFETMNKIGTVRVQYDWQPDASLLPYKIDADVAAKLAPVIKFVNHAAKLRSTKNGVVVFDYLGQMRHIIGIRDFMFRIAKDCYPQIKVRPTLSLSLSSSLSLSLSLSFPVRPSHPRVFSPLTAFRTFASRRRGRATSSIAAAPASAPRTPRPPRRSKSRCARPRSCSVACREWESRSRREEVKGLRCGLVFVVSTQKEKITSSRLTRIITRREA